MKTLEANLAATLESFRRDMAERETKNTRWQIGLWVGALVVIGLGFGVLGFLVRLPPPG